MKHRIYIIAASILALVAIVIGSWLPWHVTVSTTDGYISISNGKVLAADLALEPSKETFTDKESYYEYEIDGDKVIVGDEKTATIDSTIRFERWGKDAFLGIELEQTNPTLSTTDSKVISLADENKELKIYPVDGGIEYEIILSQAPASSTIVGMFIESENLQFCYQPPLNEEIEIGQEGIASINATHALDSKGNIILYRPENVVGSYAVYHIEKHDNIYKTGKAFHIYRPKLIDAKGSTIWGTLTIDADLGIMYISADLKWLQSASYPVVIDPTFGYTSNGASTGAITNALRGSYYAPADGNGTVDTFHVMLGGYGDGEVCTCLLYLVSDGNLVGTSVEDTHSGSTIYDWVTINANGTINVTNATSYKLIAWSSSTVNIYYDSSVATTDGYYTTGYTYPTYPDPYTASPSSSERAYSIYCTYTASGASPDISNSPSTLALGVLAPSSTYWSSGSEPSWPLTDGDAYFTVSNNGSIAVDISANVTNWTGGVGWTNVSGSPGENQIRMTLFAEGDGSGDGSVLSGTPSTVSENLSSSSNIDMEIKVETGSSFTDGVGKTMTITLIASAS